MQSLLRPSKLTPSAFVRPIRWLPPLWPAGGFPLRPKRYKRQEGTSLGRIGTLEVRLARNGGEVKAAQRLRYRVFYEEMSAIPNASAQFHRRDVDEFDPVCDHVLVLDHDVPPSKPFGRRKPRVVGTYRLLRQEVADLNQGFYTAGEFEIDKLIERKADLRFLELGRSCVLKPYRNKRTVELLWHGIWTYVLMHQIDVMIGCASLEGTRPDQLAEPLSFLHQNALAPEEWCVAALPDRHVSMDRLAPEAISTKAALHALPPLIKGYLRLGAYVGDGAVVDHQFGTTDVLMILPVARISERYIAHFGADASRHRRAS